MNVMRLLGVLALVAPVAIGTLLFVVPEFLVSWIDDGVRSILAALGAGAIGVSLTALLVATHFRYRFVRLVKAAERIAGGDYTIQVISDDGARVWVDGRLVLDAWEPHESKVDEISSAGNRRMPSPILSISRLRAIS